MPVTDGDRARDFQANPVGVPVEHDDIMADEICNGLTGAESGRVPGQFLVVADIEAPRTHLLRNEVDADPVDVPPWGHFLCFSDPDGNRWVVQSMPCEHQS